MMFDGSGCVKCPVKGCLAAYRGSECSVLRRRYGLGDPMTNADKIRAMTDEELLTFFNKDPKRLYCKVCPDKKPRSRDERECVYCIETWLKQEATT